MGGGVKGGVTTLERHLFTTHVCVSVYAEYECVDGTGYSWGAKQKWKVRDTPLDRNHSWSWSTKTSHFQCINTTAKNTESWALNKIRLLESTGDMDHNQHSKRNMSCLPHTMTLTWKQTATDGKAISALQWLQNEFWYSDCTFKRNQSF